MFVPMSGPGGCETSAPGIEAAAACLGVAPRELWEAAGNIIQDLLMGAGLEWNADAAELMIGCVVVGDLEAVEAYVGRATHATAAFFRVEAPSPTYPDPSVDPVARLIKRTMGKIRVKVGDAPPGPERVAPVLRYLRAWALHERRCRDLRARATAKFQQITANG